MNNFSSLRPSQYGDCYNGFEIAILLYLISLLAFLITLRVEPATTKT
ncbi:hypothetical protein [Acaryochloris sp. IP29b_bin.137]|nr:hypothetical protein [Acaryochloris sp. IP29b_bin.137]